LITKRKFIKKSLLCAGAAGCGFLNLSPALPDLSLSYQDQTSPDFKESWKIESKFYINTPKGVKCLLCPNECKMLINEIGDCKTRVNIENRLICIAYGNPCAIHVDPIEKKPLFHFYPGSYAYSIATGGCNLACLNCQNWEISQSSPSTTKNYDLPPKQVVEKCIENNCKSISYTYSDPVAFFEYTLETAKIAREREIKNVIVSAGYINEKPLKEWCNYIDAAHIDLKSFANEIYEMLNAGKLEPVLNTLKVLKEAGVWLEIVNLIIPSWTDDLEMIKRMCGWLTENGFENTPLHFSRFQPLYKLANLPSTPVSVLENAHDIAINEGLKFVYIGNVPGTLAENTYCPNCKKIAIARRGFRILENNIEKGNCKYCNSIIPGYWN
jgi:pyruvate formate lyase activating enzyme